MEDNHVLTSFMILSDVGDRMWDVSLLLAGDVEDLFKQRSPGEQEDNLSKLSGTEQQTVQDRTRYQ